MIPDVEKEAYVWIWLPDETRPVVAGRLEVELSDVDQSLLWGRQFLNPCSIVQ